MAGVLVLAAAPRDQKVAGSAEYRWDLPRGVPKPRVPAGNPMTGAKVQLGRYLFYDKRMSVNRSMSCATCHRQELAFTDGKPFGIGATGQAHPRSAMSLVNVAYNSAFTWSNPGLHSLEEQAPTPIFGAHPVELGLSRQGRDFLRQVRSDALYESMFPAAFPGERDPFTISNAIKAIAAFERTIISARSPYDRYHYGGDEQAIPDSAKRGEVLFFTDPISCFRCHGGFNFSDATDSERTKRSAAVFHNTGLYNLAGRISYPAPNGGVYDHTKRLADVGKFKAPTLRNVALTAPYMHDGSIPTLEAVLDHYSAGGRTIESGPHSGAGSGNRNKDRLIRGFRLSSQNREDLLAFLRSLTDQELTRDSRFSDPW